MSRNTGDVDRLSLLTPRWEPGTGPRTPLEGCAPSGPARVTEAAPRAGRRVANRSLSLLPVRAACRRAGSLYRDDQPPGYRLSPTTTMRAVSKERAAPS